MNCSCVSVDRDLWKLKLFLPGTTVTRCYICEWLFKSCLMKISKVTSLEYEPVYACWSFKVKGFFPNEIATKCCICERVFKRCLIKIHTVTSLEYELQLCVCWPRYLTGKVVSTKHNSEKMMYLWMNLQKMLD